MTTTPQHDLYQALAHAYRALADVVGRPALAEDSRRAILTALEKLEREMEVWTPATLTAYELDFETPWEAEFDDEPTHPSV